MLQPLPAIGPFDSAGLCYLLHCLPGTIPEKAVVFDHIRPLLTPGASVFGATILQGDAPRSRAAQALMDFYNRKGVFSNAGDTLADLREALDHALYRRPGKDGGDRCVVRGKGWLERRGHSRDGAENLVDLGSRRVERAAGVDDEVGAATLLCVRHLAREHRFQPFRRHARPLQHALTLYLGAER